MQQFRNVFFILSIVFLTSCTFTEEISFNENGSGNYKLNMDLSSMMGMMGSLKDSTDTKAPEKVDTTMYMKDLLELNKESISNLSEADKKAYDDVKDLKINMRMDEENEIFVMDFLLDFKDISNLDDIQEKVKKAQKLQENKVEESDPVNNKVTYFMTKKKFARKVEMLTLSAEQQKKFDESLESSKMFLSGSTYKLKYNFPNKIKDVNLKDATISADGKTLTFEIDMETVLNNPKILDFEVKF